MKRFIILIVCVILCCGIFSGCKTKDENNNDEAVVDYSEYSFTGISWTREAENDIETIRFGLEGEFVYYCSCGNPVNDSDLCEGYRYDDETKTITLDCFEITDEMVTTFKIVKCDEDELQLDFNGDIRVFTKE